MQNSKNSEKCFWKIASVNHAEFLDFLMLLSAANGNSTSITRFGCRVWNLVCVGILDVVVFFTLCLFSQK